MNLNLTLKRFLNKELKVNKLNKKTTKQKLQSKDKEETKEADALEAGWFGARGLHFVCCPQWSACQSSAAASLAHCKDCRAVGKLEVKAEAAADARRDREHNSQ